MISSEQKNIIIQVLKPYQPKMIGIFGSYARNENKAESDLDILIDIDNPKLNYFDLVDMETSISEKLKLKAQIVTKRALHPAIAPYILKDLKVISD
jgi:predicted nucleotidyltransferase